MAPGDVERPRNTRAASHLVADRAARAGLPERGCWPAATTRTCDVRAGPELFAYAWGAQFMDYGECGHINADSGLASWPEGHVLLQDLMKD